MNKEPKEKIALIGYGYWGQKLYRYLKESPQFKLMYVHFPSLRKEDAGAIVNKYGKEFVPDIETIWKDQYVPHVVIATPIKTHFAVTQEALLNYKNVLVEKPLTLTMREAEALKNLSQRKRCILMTEYTCTFSEALKKVKRIVDLGTIGKIQGIQISFKQVGRFSEYDVFALIGSHALSILDFFIPLRKCCFTAHPFIQNEGIVTSGRIDFVSDADQRGCINLSLHSVDKERKVVISGKKGNLVYDPLSKDNTITVTRIENGLEQRDYFSFDEGHNLRYALEEFYRVIKKEVPHNLNRSITITEVLEKIKRGDT